MRNFAGGFMVAMAWLVSLSIILVIFAVPVTVALVIAKLCWLGLRWALGIG